MGFREGRDVCLESLVEVVLGEVVRRVVLREEYTGERRCSVE